MMVLRYELNMDTLHSICADDETMFIRVSFKIIIGMLAGGMVITWIEVAVKAVCKTHNCLCKS